MKPTAIAAAIALAILALSLTACTSTPENTALAREAAYVALSEWQRLHPTPVRAEK